MADEPNSPDLKPQQDSSGDPASDFYKQRRREDVEHLRKQWEVEREKLRKYFK